MSGFHKVGINRALVAAVRELGRAATPHELEERGVRRVRCVSTEQVSRLIETAVEKTLRERAEKGIDAAEIGLLVDHAQLGMLRMLHGFQEVEDSRGELREHRRELEDELEQMRSERDEPASARGRDQVIERLERRVAKLVRALEQTEATLQKVAAMKNIDLGIASLYRVVQGLSCEDANLGEKRSMMKRIFEANVVLQQKRALAEVALPV